MIFKSVAALIVFAGSAQCLCAQAPGADYELKLQKDIRRFDKMFQEAFDRMRKSYRGKVEAAKNDVLEKLEVERKLAIKEAANTGNLTPANAIASAIKRIKAMPVDAPLPSFQSLLRLSKRPRPKPVPIQEVEKPSRQVRRTVDATIRTFNLDTDASHITYVVDNSGSVEGALFKKIKAELLRSLSALPVGKKFSIIFFNQKTISFPESSPEMVPLEATLENKQKAAQWIELVQTGRGAVPTQAFELAAKMESTDAIFVSDGQFPEEKIKESFAICVANKIKVHCVGVGKTNAVILNNFARSTGGSTVLFGSPR